MIGMASFWGTMGSSDEGQARLYYVIKRSKGLDRSLSGRGLRWRTWDRRLSHVEAVGLSPPRRHFEFVKRRDAMTPSRARDTAIKAITSWPSTGRRAPGS